MLPKLSLAAFGLLILTSASQAQEDTQSANWILPGCRSLLDPNNNTGMYKQGHCSGIIRGIVFMSQSACVPNGVNGNQLAAVVVRYADQQPQRWHEVFAKLIDEALTKTWPCRR
jgi:hypothetical protein